jgi:hypothetical protein
MRGENSLLKSTPWVFILVMCIISIVRSATASTYETVDNIAVYNALSRLEAEGVISDALLSSRPLSRKEVVRLIHEAEMNSEGRSEIIKGIIATLKHQIKPDDDSVKPVDSVYARYVNTNASVLTLSYSGAPREQEQSFNHNNDGDLYGRGSNYRTGFISRFEDVGPLAVYLNPEYRASNGADQGILKSGYGVLSFKKVDFMVGKDSLWWGPGYNGANLLSNNAESPTMIKVSSPEPLRLPWIFKDLGPFQYTIFVARLDRERSDFQEPYLDGIRFDFKPFPFMEIGLEKIVLLGGRNRPLTANEWIGSIIGTNSHPNTTLSDYTDSEAGGDVKLTLPFQVQPVQAYWQRDGEDGRQYKLGLPYKWADIYGIYLPRVLGHERLGLRIECSTNHISGQPNVWYTHSNYSSGMTYNGMIMGHQMGTDSRGTFVELSYLFDQRVNLALSVDQKRHNLSGMTQERTTETRLKTDVILSPHVNVSASYGYGRIENPGNSVGPAMHVQQLSGEVRYAF